MHFDFVQAVTDGYKFVWRNRHMIALLAALPFVMKILGSLAILALGMETNFLRHGLIYLPSYFLEALLAVGVMRVAVFRDQWPLPTVMVLMYGQARNSSSVRGVKAGVVFYVLMKVMTALLMGMALQGRDFTGQSPAPVEGSGDFVFLSFMIILLMVWAFRFLWLYVPMALCIDLKDYARRTQPFLVSMAMVGLWLMCYIPMAVALVLVLDIMKTAFMPGGGDPTMLYNIILILAQSALELTMILVSSVAMAFGVYQFIYPDYKPDF